MRCNETRRSLTDREETAQWLGGPGLAHSVLTNLLRGTNQEKSLVYVHNPTVYEGVVERAVVNLCQTTSWRLAAFSPTLDQDIMRYAKQQIMSGLVEASTSKFSCADSITVSLEAG